VLRLRRILAILILVSAVLFAIGAAIERNNHNSETKQHAAASGESSGETHTESGGEGGSTETHAATETHKESSEKIFGINPEAKGLVAAAVAAGVVLAVAVWFTNAALILVGAIAFGLVFAVFDVRELIHQVNESRAGLVVIAAVLAVIHLAVAVAAGAVLSSRRRPEPATTGA
jgi:Flp pilus assembly protein TadB